MIDAAAGQEHFADHIIPIWLALPESQRGTFYAPTVRHGVPNMVKPAVPEPRSRRPILVASAGDMKRAQKLGFAVREMPSLAGVKSVGQALHNQSGVAFAALSVSAISSRLNEKRVTELATLLRNEARLVEKQLANGPR